MAVRCRRVERAVGGGLASSALHLHLAGEWDARRCVKANDNDHAAAARRWKCGVKGPMVAARVVVVMSRKHCGSSPCTSDRQRSSAGTAQSDDDGEAAHVTS